MTTSPQDDLTAERAALLVHQRLVLAPTREAKEDNLKVIADALKTARQEALREAAELVLDCSSTVQYIKALDRLASEGGPRKDHP